MCPDGFWFDEPTDIMRNRLLLQASNPANPSPPRSSIPHSSTFLLPLDYGAQYTKPSISDIGFSTIFDAIAQVLKGPGGIPMLHAVMQAALPGLWI